MQSLEPDKHILPSLAEIVQQKKIGSGAYHRLYPVDVGITHGARQKMRRMVLRVPHVSEYGPNKTGQIVKQLETRDALQSHGVPVVPTYRLVNSLDHPSGDDHDVVTCVLATDLTKGGKIMVLSPTNVSDFTFPYRPNNQLFSQSRGREIKNTNDLLEQAWVSAIGITNAGYCLFRPDGFVFSLDDNSDEAFLCVGDYKHLESIEGSRDQAFRNNVSVTRWAVDSMAPFTGIPEEVVRDFFNIKLAGTGVTLPAYVD